MLYAQLKRIVTSTAPQRHLSSPARHVIPDRPARRGVLLPGVAWGAWLLFATTAHATPVKVFLLAGQSNMFGQGEVGQLLSPWNAPQPDVWIWQDDLADNVGWTALRPGFGNTDSNFGSAGDHNRPGGDMVDRFGPELTLGRALADALPGEQVAIIKHAAGGTNLYSQWDPHKGGPPDKGHMYAGLAEKVTNATQLLIGAGLEYEIAGLFWMQGESDAVTSGGVAANTYAENLTELIAAVRDDFTNPQMSIVVARIHDKLPLDDFPETDLVRSAQIGVSAADQRAIAVSTDLLSLRDDSVHFDTTGQLELGAEMAAAYMSVVTHAPGDANADNVVDGLDYLAWAARFGAVEPSQQIVGAIDGDFNGDERVDGVDYLIWGAQFETTDGTAAIITSTAIPEPQTLTLAVLAVGVVITRRRRSGWTE